jgi:hypothetical protein
MDFDDSTQLDTSQFEDQRGSGALGRVPGGGLTVGGGGLGIVALLIALVFGVSPSQLGLSGDPTGGGSTVSDNTDLAGSCRTGADADQRDDCRIVGVVNNVQAFWAAELRTDGGRTRYRRAATVLFSGSVRTPVARLPRIQGRSTALATPKSISIWVSSTTSEPGSEREAARSRRPTCWLTNMDTTFRTSPARWIGSAKTGKAPPVAPSV